MSVFRELADDESLGGALRGLGAAELTMGEVGRARMEPVLPRARREIADDAFEAAVLEGRSLDGSEAVSYALNSDDGSLDMH